MSDQRFCGECSNWIHDLGARRGDCLKDMKRCGKKDRCQNDYFSKGAPKVRLPRGPNGEGLDG